MNVMTEMFILKCVFFILICHTLFQTDEEWSVVLLLIRLSQKPLKTGNDLSGLEVPNTEPQEDEEIDWKAYLKEGWEEFELSSDDSVSIVIQYHLFKGTSKAKKVFVQKCCINSIEFSDSKTI